MAAVLFLSVLSAVPAAPHAPNVSKPPASDPAYSFIAHAYSDMDCGWAHRSVRQMAYYVTDDFTYHDQAGVHNGNGFVGIMSRKIIRLTANSAGARTLDAHTKVVQWARTNGTVTVDRRLTVNVATGATADPSSTIRYELHDVWVFQQNGWRLQTEVVRSSSD
ncbi:MAG: hypothetical protein ACLQVD_19080 [Capsulimonadaceae bacterium]